MIVIGVSGKAQSGKDTFAKYYADNFDFVRYAFADPLKEMVNSLFNWDERHAFGDLKEVVDSVYKFSPRKAYQYFGTEFMRALNPDFWVEEAERRISKYERVIIPDVRFENEAYFCRKHGYLIHIFRDGITEVNAHVSESGVRIDVDRDFVVYNNTSIEHLYHKAKWIYDIIGKENASKIRKK